MIRLHVDNVTVPQSDVLSASDIYCVVGSGETRLRTITQLNNNSITVNAMLVFPVCDTLAVDVFDADGVRDDHLAHFELDCAAGGPRMASNGATTLSYRIERVQLVDAREYGRLVTVDNLSKTFQRDLELS